MTQDRVKFKKLKKPSSIWEIVSDERLLEKKLSAPIFEPLRALGLDGYTHWPSVYNFQEHIEILACETTFIAKIELYSTAFAWWFWSNLVPSPVELTRKFLLGGYKCGFYLPIKFKSPLTLFLSDDGVTFLAEVARPVTTFFFYWWLASSAFSALDTWHTVQMLIDQCHTEGYICALSDGTQDVNGSGLALGGVWHVIEDLNHRHLGEGGVDVHDSNWKATLAASFEPGDNVWDVCRFEISNGFRVLESHDVDLSVPQDKYNIIWSPSHYGDPVAAIIVGLRLHLSGPWTGSYGKVTFNRFVVNGFPL